MCVNFRARKKSIEGLSTVVLVFVVAVRKDVYDSLGIVGLIEWFPILEQILLALNYKLT